jgi:phosphatidate cytidylyltransferase
MAFNVQTFKTRALSALLFAVIMLAGLLWSFWTFTLLFIIIHFGCWYEFIKLMNKIGKQNFLLRCCWGLIYITLPVILLIDLRAFGLNMNLPLKGNIYGLLLPLVIIGSMWVNDTMAYLVGSFIGKTPFSKISPKKTWEGTIGGAILCIIVIGFAASLYTEYSFPFRNYDWFIIAALCAVFGTTGDLIESKIKRMANVKDSGNIMPGHGGFLDRFDSLLIATPFVWLYVKLFVLQNFL